MASEGVFFCRKTQTSAKVSTDCTFDEALPSLKGIFNIPENVPEIKAWYVAGVKPTIIHPDDILSEIFAAHRIRHIEIWWKDPPQHGDQYQDLTQHGEGKVLSGYSRYVEAEGGSVTVGDPSGASVFIPAGAMRNSGKITVQTVASTRFIPGNVTRAVMSDPDKVNRQVNGK